MSAAPSSLAAALAAALLLLAWHGYHRPALARAFLDIAFLPC